jgi:hypothetical protein
VSFGRAKAAAFATLALAAAGAPAPAAASVSGNREICADRVSVYDGPGGFVIAYLYRPQRRRVISTARKRTWSLVRFDTGPRGWIPSSKICK